MQHPTPPLVQLQEGYTRMHQPTPSMLLVVPHMHSGTLVVIVVKHILGHI